MSLNLLNYQSSTVNDDNSNFIVNFNPNFDP